MHLKTKMVVSLNMSHKDVSSAHQGCIYLIKNADIITV